VNEVTNLRPYGGIQMFVLLLLLLLLLLKLLAPNWLCDLLMKCSTLSKMEMAAADVRDRHIHWPCTSQRTAAAPAAAVVIMVVHLSVKRFKKLLERELFCQSFNLQD